MTNGIWLGLGFLFGLIFSFYAGLYYSNVNKKLDELLKKEPETESFVTKTDPGFTNENMLGHKEDSVIVMPKTPQQIEFEEREELRRMNLK